MTPELGATARHPDVSEKKNAATKHNNEIISRGYMAWMPKDDFAGTTEEIETTIK